MLPWIESFAFQKGLAIQNCCKTHSKIYGLHTLVRDEGKRLGECMLERVEGEENTSHNNLFMLLLFIHANTSQSIHQVFITCSNFLFFALEGAMNFPWNTCTASIWPQNEKVLLKVLLNFFTQNLFQTRRKYVKKPAIQMHKNTHSLHTFNSNSNPVSGATIVHFFFLFTLQTKS